MANELEKLMGGKPTKQGAATANGALKKADEEPKEQITVKLPISLVEELREASKFLSIPPYELNMRAIAEQAIRRELKRLKSDIERVRAFRDGLDTKDNSQAVNG